MSNNMNNHTPWVEKYRPKNLTEVSHQNEVVSTLQNAVQTNRLPHLLLYGPPGTGKTSVALALCRTLWSPDQIGKRVLELNASDERGISVVRDKIKHFASLAVGTGGSAGMTVQNQALMKKKRKNFFQKPSDKDNKDDEDVEMKDVSEEVKVDDGDGKNSEEGKMEEDTLEVTESYPNPPFKVIILDEADTVTPDAQAALRRIIEAHSKITRFILICNYVTRIIEPLASRCAKFRFQSLPPESMMNRLQSISKAENVRFVQHPNLVSEEERTKEQVDVLNEILNLCQGDMRRAVTTLQSAHLLSGGIANNNDGEDNNIGYIKKDSIAEMAGLPPMSVIDSLMETLQSPKSTYATMEQNVNDIILEGYAADHIMKELLKKLIVMDSKTLSEMNKANIAIKIAEAEKNLVDSADETLQLLVVCSLILKCFH